MLKSGVFGICCVCATLAAQTYVPQNVGEFYPEPGKTARLTVKAGEGAARACLTLCWIIAEKTSVPECLSGRVRRWRRR